MPRVITILYILIFSNSLKSQNIYSAIHLNENRDYKTLRPKKVAETNTFYGTNGKKTSKSIKLFDEAGMIVSEERFDESGMRGTKLTYTNDTAKKIVLSRILERLTSIGNQVSNAVFVYDSNLMLIKITEKNKDNLLVGITEIENNAKGHPVKLSNFDGNGNLMGVEEATYLYEQNLAVTKVLSANGTALSSDTIKISFINAHQYPASDETYNEKGDLVSWTSTSLNGKQTIYEEEITYDSFGNPILQKIFKVTMRSNGKKKREIDRVFEKKYFY